MYPYCEGCCKTFSTVALPRPRQSGMLDYMYFRGLIARIQELLRSDIHPDTNQGEYCLRSSLYSLILILEKMGHYNTSKT